MAAKKTVELVNDGFWIRHTCDEKCHLSKPKDKKARTAQIAKTKVSAQKTPWCILQCDRADVDPKDPTKGEMCFMLSFRTPDGNRHGYYGKLGMSFEASDGYTYSVTRKKTPRTQVKKK